VHAAVLRGIEKGADGGLTSGQAFIHNPRSDLQTRIVRCVIQIESMHWDEVARYCTWLLIVSTGSESEI
jgi:hypothetical protein